MDEGISVVLGCDPLLAEKTGIGHYTNQIGIRLARHEQVQNLRLFAHGAFYSHELLSFSESIQKRGNLTSDKSLLTIFRPLLARNQVAVWVYQRTMPKFDAWRLDKLSSDHIFHSPNFVLPDYLGRKVVTFHDLSILRMPEAHPSQRVSLVSDAMARAVDAGAHIITDTERVRSEVMEHYGLSPERVTAIHLAASDVFKPRKKEDTKPILSAYGLEHGGYFLSVATIEPRKNISNILRAHEIYCEGTDKPKPMVLIGGAGWNSESEHAEIKRLSSKGNVIYLGYVNDSLLPMFYSGALALVFISGYEGFGLPVLEAMQSGVPVITANNTAMEEVVGDTALLCDCDDIEGLAELLTSVSVDEATRGKLIGQGLMRASFFSWESCVNQTIQVYRGL